MRIDPQTLLRGLGRFVAVVLVAGLAGAGIGIALAKLSGNDAGDTPVLPATASSTTDAPTRAAQPSSSTTADGETAPDVRVLSALLGPRSRSTGRALVAARVRLTNRAGRPLVIDRPALLSRRDEVQPKPSASGAATSLPRTLAPGASITRTLRFISSSGIAGRLTARPAAKLRIAKRIVVLKLTKTSRR